MKSVFSTQLITRAKRIFEKRSGCVVSEEETEMYLEKLAQLGLLAAGSMKQNRKEVVPHGKS